MAARAEIKKDNVPASTFPTRPAPAVPVPGTTENAGGTNVPPRSTGPIPPLPTSELPTKVPDRPPLVSAASVQQAPSYGLRRGGPARSQSLGGDPFDADWASQAARTGQTPTNPFARQQQTFQISM